MVRIQIPFLVLLALLCGTAGVSANGFDPDQVPAIGSIAPAFGLHAFGSSPEKAETDADDVVQLDSICGLRPGETKGVLLLFLETKQIETLDLINGWHRRFARQGLELLAISVDSKPIEFSSKAARMRLRFPVLNDQHRIVAQRYGVSDTPFSMLLNSECRVLGFSNKPLSEEEAAITKSIQALLEGQIGTPSGSMD